MNATTTDPHLTMRHIRVCFAHSRYDYETSINGTRASILQYFSRGPLNVGINGEDDLQYPTKIEFLPADGSGEVISEPIAKRYTNRERIYHDCRWIGDVAQFGPDDWRCSAAAGDPTFPSREDAIHHLRQSDSDN